MRDHTKLRAFELADEIALVTYKLTSHFPEHERYGLSSQMRRAAVSVPANIVEGCARESRSDYIRFLEIAFGSLKELHYQFDLSRRLGYFDGHDINSCKSLFSETEKVLSSLLRSLRKKS